MVKIVVGNKCDVEKQERQVEFKMARAYAEQKGYKFFETSALSNNESIKDVFSELAE